MAYYAWSPILYARDEKTGRDVSLKLGETVTKEKLGVSNEDWDALAEAGAIRENKPPNMPPEFQGSIVDYLRQQAREAALEAGEEAGLAELNAVGEVG